MQILKRNGKVVPYQPSQILKAIKSANDDLKEQGKETVSLVKLNAVYEDARMAVEKLNHDVVSVDEINDIVEVAMSQNNCHELLRQFVAYRYQHKLMRESNTTDKSINELINDKNDYWIHENSNKNAKLVTTQRDYIAGITSTDIARRFILPKNVVKAHDEGFIHVHDIDYMAENARTNCSLVNLEDMLQNGTVVNGIMIEKPHRFITACTIATQIITAVSSSQYGGVTVTLTHLAPFVRNSFYRHYRFYLKEVLGKKVPSEINEDTPMNSELYSDPDAMKYAKKQIKKEVTDGVQTFNYQVNSMSSTNGQSPFLSVNMYLGETDKYKDELAMIIEEFLLQRILGFKNEQGVYVTVAFPKLLYILEEDNIHEDSKYYYLTELAAKCSAKRLVPDYISEKIMKETKINRLGQGDAYPSMGCRSFLSADNIKGGNIAKAKNYDPNKGKYYGRFNVGVVSLNLGAIAVESKGDEEKFWELMEEYSELAHQAHKVRIKRIENATTDIAPILYQHGAFARLKKGDKIKPLIHNGYATASLGYAGVYEAVKYMKGVSHTSPEGKDFAMRIMQFMNDKCDMWKAQEDIGYSVYGTPIESTTYKFAKSMKKLDPEVFVKMDGKDRNFVTNSFHVFVEEEIDPFEKLKLEGEFQRLSPGGVISYVETCDLTKNTEAVLTLIKFIYNNIMYAELNTKSDYCQECGYDGEIQIIDKDGKLVYHCPNCGNENSNKMNVARRVCGYISTNIPNQGRLDEIRNRYVHVDNHN